MNRKWTKMLSGLLVATFCLLSGCSLPGLGSNVHSGVVIAGGSTSERQITAEIVSQMIRHYLPDVSVSIINNLGTSTLIHQSLTHGDANMSGCMYTGTSLTGELGQPPIRDSKKAYQKVVEGYAKEFDTKWYPSFGFANTYAFMVTRAFAEKNNVKKVSDLARFKDTIRVGVDTHWLQREGDGYKAFQEIYGFGFSDVHAMDIGLVYSAVHAGEMDAVLGYSTDGRINSYDLVVLEDDRHLFPPYDASPVAKYAILEKYPELDDCLLRLHNAIDSETMQKMNRMSDEDHIEPAVIAKRFLEEHHYFENVTQKELDALKKDDKRLQKVSAGKNTSQEVKDSHGKEAGA